MSKFVPGMTLALSLSGKSSPFASVMQTSSAILLFDRFMYAVFSPTSKMMELLPEGVLLDLHVQVVASIICV